MVLGAVHIGFLQTYRRLPGADMVQGGRKSEADGCSSSEAIRVEGFAPAPLGLALCCKRIESEGRNARQARLVSAEDRLRPPRLDCILAPGQGQHYFI